MVARRTDIMPPELPPPTKPPPSERCSSTTPTSETLTMPLRLPAIYQWPEAAEEGGLAAYGPRFTQLVRELRGRYPPTLPTHPIQVALRTGEKITPQHQKKRRHSCNSE